MMGHEVIAKQGKHRGSIAHTNTGVIQQKAVMERERLGETLIGPEHNATRDNMGKRRKQQQQTQLAEARQRDTTPVASQAGSPSCKTNDNIVVTTIVSRGWPVGARLNFRLLSIQNL